MPVSKFGPHVEADFREIIPILLRAHDGSLAREAGFEIFANENDLVRGKPGRRILLKMAVQLVSDS